VKAAGDMTMNIELVPAAREDSAILGNLFDYYMYDFSEVVGLDVADDGRFTPPSLDSYWEDSWRHPLLARVDGRYAGFALVHQRSRITADPTTWDVAEFFVMRRYRRRGVGAALATRVFDSFRGRWEVRQVFANTAATAFWRSVIARYTKGCFEQTVIDDDRWRGPVQNFDNSTL
jgi:predicted acetyltransferase